VEELLAILERIAGACDLLSSDDEEKLLRAIISRDVSAWFRGQIAHAKNLITILSESGEFMRAITFSALAGVIDGIANVLELINAHPDEQARLREWTAFARSRAPTILEKIEQSDDTSNWSGIETALAAIFSSMEIQFAKTAPLVGVPDVYAISRRAIALAYTIDEGRVLDLSMGSSECLELWAKLRKELPISITIQSDGDLIIAAWKEFGVWAQVVGAVPSDEISGTSSVFTPGSWPLGGLTGQLTVLELTNLALAQLYFPSNESTALQLDILELTDRIRGELNTMIATLPRPLAVFEPEISRHVLR
jgi:hypothetical protein